ncbi:MAG: Eco57I restriction-modification methylase domain-containing protein, partial [Thermoplasmata archaeon]
IESDLFEKVEGDFDVIAFNPPYLPDDSMATSWAERAWSGGSEGTDIILRFMDEAWKHLSPGGHIVLILSSMGGLLRALQAAKDRYTTKLLEEKHMFFESIYAYRLRLKPR